MHVSPRRIIIKIILKKTLSKSRHMVSDDGIDFRYFVALMFKVRGARLLTCVWKAWRKRVEDIRSIHG